MTGFMRLAAIAAALALTAAAQGDTQPGLTVQMGEAWIFHVENGQPSTSDPAFGMSADRIFGGGFE